MDEELTARNAGLKASTVVGQEERERKEIEKYIILRQERTITHCAWHEKLFSMSRLNLAKSSQV